MIFNATKDVAQTFPNAIVAIGNFDGVHLGHRKIIESALALGRRLAKPVGVLTFDPHPSMVLKNGNGSKLIDSIEQRTQKLLALGVDFVVIHSFNRELAALTPKQFVSEILVQELKLSHCVTGYNFRFGNGAKGDTATLKVLAVEHGFGYTEVSEVLYEEQELCSSAIRKLVREGRILKVAELLGEHFTRVGVVVEGLRMSASELNTPTANISLDPDLVAPLFGVYLVRATLPNGDSHYGVANIGVKPTISNGHTPLLEVYLYEVAEDLCGLELKVEFLSFIRPERRFENVEQLKYAIEFDKSFGRYLVTKLPLSAQRLATNMRGL